MEVVFMNQTFLMWIFFGINVTIISSYSILPQTLYNLYARKIVLVGLGPLGCIPNMRAKTSNDSCNENLNTWAQHFNSALQELVGTFASNYTDTIITLANPYFVLENLIQNPLENGKITIMFRHYTLLLLNLQRRLFFLSKEFTILFLILKDFQ